jgi:hypothetical protein
MELRGRYLHYQRCRRTVGVLTELLLAMRTNVRCKKFKKRGVMREHVSMDYLIRIYETSSTNPDVKPFLRG